MWVEPPPLLPQLPPRQTVRFAILVCAFLGAQKAGISWGEARKRIYMVDSKG